MKTPVETLDSADLPPGKRSSASSLGADFHAKYEVVRRLGAGAMGEVYLARHRTLDRLVAVKTVLGLDEPRRALFVREGRALAKLSHPSILDVHDADESTVPYLVFEYVEGESLRDRLQKRTWLPPAEAGAIVAAILDGLAVAHRAGIVHRDIKPENILLPNNGGVKIADFGLARFETPDQLTTSTPGVVMGTPLYMAPEQARGEKAGPQADLWATGVVLFELVAGTVPFLARSLADLITKHIEERAPDLCTLREGVPPAFRDVVGKALTRELTARYATADQFAQELRAALGAPPSPRRAPAPVPNGVRVAVIVAAATFAMRFTGTGTPPVDPRLVGNWECRAAGATYTWSVDPQGAYHYRLEAPGAAPYELDGSFTTHDATWNLSSTAGALTGTWKLKPDGRLVLTFLPGNAELTYARPGSR